ncbi:hypothetical protein BRE01_62420 [Brevibacillus reuszeri]|uniref:Uncharacterized protein n=1 Tax=Brevibacillus reuszeri TaxID=54915 RepID=A0ABQ0TXF1_9BACL|nr:hypothetical protein BRE01_62420 [Brevibacillus reuszeri]
MDAQTFYIISTISVILIGYKTVLEIEKLLHERKKRKEEEKNSKKTQKHQRPTKTRKR